jgi:hypothetical protein
MRKTLIGLFDSDTSFDRAAERPKNSSQQVFPTHADCPKKEERFASLEASLYARNAAVLGSSSRRPPHRFVMARGRVGARAIIHRGSERQSVSRCRSFASGRTSPVEIGANHDDDQSIDFGTRKMNIGGIDLDAVSRAKRYAKSPFHR